MPDPSPPPHPSSNEPADQRPLAWQGVPPLRPAGGAQLLQPGAHRLVVSRRIGALSSVGSLDQDGGPGPHGTDRHKIASSTPVTTVARTASGTTRSATEAQPRARAAEPADITHFTAPTPASPSPGGSALVPSRPTSTKGTEPLVQGRTTISASPAPVSPSPARAERPAPPEHAAAPALHSTPSPAADQSQPANTREGALRPFSSDPPADPDQRHAPARPARRQTTGPPLGLPINRSAGKPDHPGNHMPDTPTGAEITPSAGSPDSNVRGTRPSEAERTGEQDSPSTSLGGSHPRGPSDPSLLAATRAASNAEATSSSRTYPPTLSGTVAAQSTRLGPAVPVPSPSPYIRPSAHPRPAGGVPELISRQPDGPPAPARSSDVPDPTNHTGSSASPDLPAVPRPPLRPPDLARASAVADDAAPPARPASAGRVIARALAPAAPLASASTRIPPPPAPAALLGRAFRPGTPRGPGHPAGSPASPSPRGPDSPGAVQSGSLSVDNATAFPATTVLRQPTATAAAMTTAPAAVAAPASPAETTLSSAGPAADAASGDDSKKVTPEMVNAIYTMVERRLRMDLLLDRERRANLNTWSTDWRPA